MGIGRGRRIRGATDPTALRSGKATLRPKELDRRLRPFPALDGVRALAIVLVVASHLAPSLAPGGFVGVDLFFVLSGFLITSILLGAVRIDGRLPLLQFYLRRGRRLLPAVVTLMLVYSGYLVVARRGHERVIGFETIASVLTYVNNWVGVAGHEVPWQMDHLWSLSVEEQFYLLWPVVLVLLLKRGTSRVTVLRLTAGLAVGSALLRAMAWMVTGDFNIPYLATPFRMDGILLGCLLAELYVWRSGDRLFRALAVRSLPIMVATATTVILATILDIETGPSYIVGIAVVVACGALLVASVVGNYEFSLQRGAAMRPLYSPVARWVGRRSYSIYIWQNPVMWGLTGPLRGSWLWGSSPLNVVAAVATRTPA
jgi:peptidoglycan/LPS O-acetylase OafA/YrhL